MADQFMRSELIFGAEAINRLKSARVAVFGIGGVGGYAVEALARGGVGALDLIDGDSVSLTNLNRQIIALHSTVGMPKAEVARRRVLDINPECRVRACELFFAGENAGEFNFKDYDYVVDAIDSVGSKLDLISACAKENVPIISAMGAGSKLDPTGFEVADIYETSVCPLARVMRRELKKRGIDRLKVVYSKEQPAEPDAAAAEACAAEGDLKAGRVPPGSVSFVPPVMGLIIAGEVIKDIISAGEQR